MILEDRAEARVRFEQSLAIRRELGSRPGLVDCLTDLGTLELESGRMEEAKEYFLQAVELARPLDNPQKLALALGNLGLALANSGEASLAHGHLVEAVDLNLATGLVPAALSTMASFGQLVARAGRPHLAALVFAFILDQTATTAETRMVAEEHLAGLGHLGDQLESARTQASHLNIEEVATMLREPL